MRNFSKDFLVLMFVFGFTVPCLWAQKSALQVYSYTEDPAISIMGPTIVKIVRDGPKEAVDQIMPAGPGRDKAFHTHLLYDFQAHKIYTKVVSDQSVPCSVMDYTSPAAPREFDMISSAADDMKDIENQHPKQIGSETLNGIATNVFEVPTQDGKEQVWVAKYGGFPVKVIITGSDGKAMTILEVKQLSFAKPLASALLPPAGCTAIQGEASAQGVRAEFGTDAPTGTPATAMTNSSPRPAAGTARVTAVHLEVTPDSYAGPCPVKVHLRATLTANGSGSAYYQFQAGAVGANRLGNVDVNAAGTVTVESDGQARRTPLVPSVRFLAGMEPRGHQENAKWTDVQLNITCTPAQ